MKGAMKYWKSAKKIIITILRTISRVKLGIHVLMILQLHLVFSKKINDMNIILEIVIKIKKKLNHI